MGIFEFTEEDLKSNKRGFISPKQREWIEILARGIRRSSKNGAWIILGFLFFGTCLILALFLQNESTRKLLFSNLAVFIALAITAIVVFLIIALSIYLAQRQADKLREARVHTAEGIIRLDESYSSKAAFTSYYVFVGKQRFGFTEDMSHVFPEGSRFRVFYCKAGVLELILSFEKIG
ncbi:MAG: hypothetical protein H7Y59_00145 [Anaerolineales bacterium]|nr:hypothetical protein [Anaerolineales bacterium]